MRYLEFTNEFRNNNGLIELTDVKKRYPDFDRRRLSEWQKKGYIKKLIKGYYLFSDIVLTEESLYYIANRIYTPSYVSFEMALSRYGLIPESTYLVTSATTLKKATFITNSAQFSYHQISPDLFWGYKLAPIGKSMFCFASVEKAVLDYLYINTHLQSEEDFAATRINRKYFMERYDFELADNYLGLFDNKQLAIRYKELIKYVRD